jgi:cell wall-associated NlpC family hydrolase
VRHRLLLICGLAAALLAAAAGGVVAWRSQAHASAEPAAVAPPARRSTPAPAVTRKAKPVPTLHRPAHLPPPPPLPTSSPWAMPPMLHLTARRAPASRGLARRVLHNQRILLSPTARASIRAGEVRPGALTLLADAPRVGSPLLVFSASGSRLRVQETTLWMTRRALRVLLALPAHQRPAIRMTLAGSGLGQVEAPHGGMLGAQAVAIAERWLGVPYVWGGANPRTGLDCSGLTMEVYRRLGIRLDHYAAFQFLEGMRIGLKDLMPGDLVFFEPKADGPGHVGLYIGNGRFIHAPHTGDVVRISSLLQPPYDQIYMGAVRPY